VNSARQPRLDPELAAINVMIPHFDLTDMPRARALELKLAEQSHSPTPGVTSRDFAVTGSAGHTIAVRVYRPIAPAPQRPALFYIHGGGFMLGGLHTEDERCEIYSAQGECIVVGIDYRLAPEHPFPAAFEDCVDVLDWIALNATEFGIDPRRIAVGGNSAGGALAAGIALRSRTEGPALSHQFLISPVLDHRSNSHSALTYTDTPVWSRSDNLYMWRSYLDGATEPIDFRASPSLADDLAGAPPLWIWIADQDPLRDEGLEYVTRLQRAGVQVGYQQYLGTFHGFDGYRMTEIGQRAITDHVWALRQAFSR
jgi:acetyl esterase